MKSPGAALLRGPFSALSAPELVADSAKIFHMHEESLLVLHFLSHPEKADGVQNLLGVPAIQSSINSTATVLDASWDRMSKAHLFKLHCRLKGFEHKP